MRLRCRLFSPISIEDMFSLVTVNQTIGPEEQNHFAKMSSVILNLFSDFWGSLFGSNSGSNSVELPELNATRHVFRLYEVAKLIPSG